MAKKEEKTYTHNGKTIKIIPARKEKFVEPKSLSEDGEKVKEKKVKKAEIEKGIAKFAIGDRVCLKNISIDLAGSGFTESVITKVFKSNHDSSFRYSIRSNSGNEKTLVEEDQIKPR